MYLITLCLTVLLSHAGQFKTECDHLLFDLEQARGQRVPSLVLRSQLNEVYARDPAEFMRQLLVAQARFPTATLEENLRTTLANLRQVARRR